MRPIDADELMKKFPCTSKCRNCGQDKDGILPCDIKDTIKETPTIGDKTDKDCEVGVSFDFTEDMDVDFFKVRFTKTGMTVIYKKLVSYKEGE